jgi:hypothetical protein
MSGQKSSVPADQVWSRLPDGVLQGACDGKGRAYTQSQTEYAAVELPQAVLEAVSAAQPLDASPARRHLRLV